METTHFFALLIMIILMIVSLVFYGKGLVHLVTLGYAVSLALIGAINGWEILFFMPVLGSGLIALILFSFSMSKGDWL